MSNFYDKSNVLSLLHYLDVVNENTVTNHIMRSDTVKCGHNDLTKSTC